MNGSYAPAYRLHGRESTGCFVHYYVYALFFRDNLENRGYVKIGHTKQPNRRLIQLKTGCPMQAVTMALIEIGPKVNKARRVENALHKELNHRRSKKRGEWFSYDADNKKDRDEIGSASKRVFRKHLGPDHDWWQFIDIGAAERAERERRHKYLKAKSEKDKADKWDRIRRARAKRAEFEQVSKMIELERKVFGGDDTFIQITEGRKDRLEKEVKELEREIDN